MSFKLGKPGTGERQQTTYLKVRAKETLAVRILPPMGELADKGVWSRWYEIHYGYKNAKGRQVPFQSTLIKNRKTKMVEQQDPALERIENFQAKEIALKQELAGLKEGTAEHAQVERKLNAIEAALSRFNLEKSHYMLALDLDGKVGLLKLKYKEKLAFDELRKKLMAEENIDPISVDQGIYVEFTKNDGRGPNSIVSVAPMYISEKQPNGKTAKVYNFLPLDNDEVLGRLEREYKNLDTLYPKFTVEQVARIVEGNEMTMEEVLSENDPTRGGKAEADAPKAAPKVAAPPAPAKRSPVKEDKQLEDMEADLSMNDEPPSKGLSEEVLMDLEAEMAAITKQPAKAAAPKPAATKSAFVAKPAKAVQNNVDDMSEDEFLNMLEEGDM